MIKRPREKSAEKNAIHLSTSVFAGFLTKLAKHLALMACFMIVGISRTGSATSHLAIFVVILSAAVIHSVGRVLQRRVLFSVHRRLQP
ncbi:MAG TPA: hypothetical protein VF452_06805 [Candidatus Binatia bacterium]